MNDLNKDVIKEEEPAAAVRETDGGYLLRYTEEGVFFSFSPGGSAADREKCLVQLKRKGLGAAAIDQAKVLIESGSGETAMICGACSETILDEEALVVIEKGNMAATLTLLPPDEKGKSFTKETLMAFLNKEYGICFGIEEDAINGLLEKREYQRPVVIAYGRKPEDGEDGQIEFHFSLEKNIRNVLEEKEDGRIDFREACKIENVREGQLLVTRKPAGKGTDGMDVLGREVAAKKGREAVMPIGKNVILSEDKNSLFAKISGVASLQFGKVIVAPAYTVSGDVDMAVGNIDFDGDVLIEGNVNSGFSVRADGTVTVMGVVEDAHIESGGDIVLKRGIQGADKGTLRAGGSIYALFIQRADAQAEEKVCAGYILHSRVRCEGKVELTGEKGMLVGGITDAAKGLQSRVIGANSGIQTIINIGASPKKRERYLVLKDAIKEVKIGAERLEMALKSNAGGRSIANMDVRMQITKKLFSMRKEEKSMEREFEALKMEVMNAAQACVHVPGTVYPGTRISIGNTVYQVRSEESFVTFLSRNGQIVSEPCTYREKD